MIGGLKTTSRYLLASASLIGILAFSAPEASAQNLQEIQAQIDSMQATIKALQKQVQDAKAEAAAATTAAANAGGSDLDLKVKWRGAPEFSSEDGKIQDEGPRPPPRGLQRHRPGRTTLPAGLTSVRPRSAAPVSASKASFGTMSNTSSRSISPMTRCPSRTRMREYTGLAKGLGLRVGNFKTFNSLDQLNSSNYQPSWSVRRFVEAWGIDRQIGASAIYATRPLYGCRQASSAPFLNTTSGGSRM